MMGAWTNPQGGSYGPFSCSQTSPQSSSSSSLLCDVCKKVILPDNLRYNCTVCTPEWNCCAQCFANASPPTTPTLSSSANPHPNPYPATPSNFTTNMEPTLLPLSYPQSIPNHPHPLEPDMVYPPTVAGGQCCAEVVRNALRVFRARPLWGKRPSPSSRTFSWLTYGQIGACVDDVVRAVRELLKKDELSTVVTPWTQNCFAICADNSPVYVAAMLSAVLLDYIVVPIHPVLDVPSLQHIFKKTNPEVCFVGAEYKEKLRVVLDNVKLVVVMESTELPDTGSTSIPNT
jgi:hypothetical protein